MSLPFNARGVNIAVDDFGSVSVSERNVGPQKTYISRHLRNSLGSDSVTGNYSVTPEKFYIAPGPGEVYRIARMLVFLEDSKINADDYGAIAGGLTNGMKLTVEDSVGTVLLDLMDGGTVNSSAEWAEYCFDAEHKAWGVGSEFLTVRWTFTKGGVYIRLVGDDDERLVITGQDNLTGLVEQEFIVQGYIE
jgi:hypothetical protein